MSSGCSKSCGHWMPWANLLLLSLFLAHSARGQGVCYRRISTLTTAVAYSRTSYLYTTSCGWNGWTTCTRTGYRQTSTTTFRTVYSSLFGCCSGYSQLGNTCNPICTGNCNGRGTCVTPNVCSCNAGWTSNDCSSDVDECSSSSTNNCGQVCNNTVGSYTCSCNSGYSLDSNGRTCTEIHECNDMTDNCEHNCHNTAGSFYCSCRTGYSLSSDEYSCLNIDECSTGANSCTQDCIDTPGSYTCSCQAGYMLHSDQHTCVDIDECSTGANTCTQICTNTIGSYTCSCRTGYTLNSNGRTCDDVNECQISNGGCTQTCSNTAGSYECSCINSGYTLSSDRRTCIELDLCSSSQNFCEQICSQQNGVIMCSCGQGYTLASDGHMCNDINECSSSSTNMCEQVCNNLNGSYTCSCQTGYTLNSNGHTCTDINECMSEIARCEHTCTNTPGSYFCSCNSGFVLDVNGYGCDDINECGGENGCAQVCRNSAGSFQCSCHPGYALEPDGTSCSNINECAVQMGGCEQICWDTEGSFNCSCRSGYMLNQDHRTCSDINECALNTDTCATMCFNTDGSYTCGCAPGYMLSADEQNCLDVDECSDGTDQCEQTCTNTQGSYSCSCTSGFSLTTDLTSCLGTPQSFLFSQVESTQFLLSWNPPVYDSRDGNVQAYSLTCTSDEDTNYVLRISREVEGTQFRVRELEPFTSYNCCVAAHTATGSSPFLCSTNRTAEDAPETRPEVVSLVSDSPNSILITVAPPIRPNGRIIAYTLYIAFDNETSTTKVEMSGNGNLTIDGVYPYQLVMFQVSASTSAGEGPRSVWNEIRTQQAVPTAISALSVEVISNQSIHVRWNPPVRYNGILTNYTLRVYNRFSNFSKDLNVPSNGRRRITIDGLYPFIPYTVKVTASNAIGEGPPTLEIVYTEYGVPDVPILSNVIRTHAEQAKIIWIPLTPDQARGVLTHLQVVYAIAVNGTCSYAGIRDTSNMMQMNMTEEIDTQSEAIIGSLQATQQYCVAIQVSTIAGASGFSQVKLLSLPSNVFIQVRLSLTRSVPCQEYVSNNIEQKITDISSAVVRELLQSCECPYSLEYITNSTLLCGTSSEEAIYQNNLLNSGSTQATDLKQTVQSWVNSNPLIMVGGMTQSLLSYCLMDLTTLGDTEECETLNPTTESPITESSTTQSRDEGTEPASVERQLNIGVIAGGLIGGIAFVLLLIVLMGFIGGCLRKNSQEKKIGNIQLEEDIYDDLVLPPNAANIAYGIKQPNKSGDGLETPEGYVDTTEVHDEVPQQVPMDYELSQRVPNDYEVSQEDDKEVSTKSSAPGGEKKIARRPSKYLQPDYEESQRGKVSQQVPHNYDYMTNPTTSPPPGPNNYEYMANPKTSPFRPNNYEYMANPKTGPSVPNNYEYMANPKTSPPVPNYECMANNNSTSRKSMDRGEMEAAPTDKKSLKPPESIVHKTLPQIPIEYEEMRGLDPEDDSKRLLDHEVYDRINESDEEIYETMI